MKFVHSLVILSTLLVLCATQVASAQSYRSDNWFPVFVNGKAGYIDRSGKVVLEPRYDGASYFSEGLARISVGRDTIITEGFSQGFIDETGKIVIEPKWDVVSYFSGGLAAVGFDQTKQKIEIKGRVVGYTSASHTWYRWGFIDRSGKLVIETKFSDVSEFVDGIAVANTDRYEPKYGFIDKQGKWAIEPKFEHASRFSEGLARIFVNGKYGFIDKAGKMVIKPRYSWARDFSDGLACVKVGGDVIQPVGMSSTRHNADYAFIDKTGKVKFKVGRGGCEAFSNGIARVAIGPGHRAIDKTGTFLFDSSLDIRSDFNEGLAEIFLKGNEIGFIDTTGQIVFKKSYGKADDFYRGLAEVCESYDFAARCGYIDKTGKVIWEPTK